MINIHDIFTFLTDQSESYTSNYDPNIHNFTIHKVNNLDSISENRLSWLKTNSISIELPKHCILIVPHTFKENNDISNDIGFVYIKVDYPKLILARLINAFFIEKPTHTIEPSARISDKTTMGKNVTIGHNVSIKGQVNIGNNVIIEDNVSIIGPVNIGDTCIIHQGAVVGSEGFGYMLNENKQWESFPHLCGVEIHNDVSIGANTCIDKGSLHDTTIGENTKIDNMCHIGHGVCLGKSVIITAGCTFSGGVIVEDYVWMAPNVTTREHITIGENAFIGLGSTITKNISSGMIAVGSPAKEIKKNTLIT